MVQNRKVVGVRCKDGECLDADNVVCNADPPSVYDKMLKKSKQESALQAKNGPEWNTPWAFLCIILVQRRSMTTCNTIP